jgi:hypothetical protein
VQSNPGFNPGFDPGFNPGFNPGFDPGFDVLDRRPPLAPEALLVEARFRVGGRRMSGAFGIRCDPATTDLTTAVASD